MTVIAEFEKPTKCEDCPCFYKTEGAFKDECQLTHKEIENYFIIDKSCPLKGGGIMKLQEITLDEFNRLCPGNNKTYFSNGCIFDEETDNLIAFSWYPSATEAASKYYKVVKE